MNRKPNAFEKFANFFMGKGFYLVVLVCVAAIALSGFYLVRSVRDSLGVVDDQPASGTATIITTPAPDTGVVPTDPPPVISVTEDPEPIVTENVKEPDPAPSPEPSVSTGPTALVFTWPVNGSILADYSVEALAYDVTMADWRTHAGLDLAAEVGTEVMATAAGTVVAVYEDDLLGTTVVIQHNASLASFYSNLASVPTVAVGDTVSTGTIIGAVGRTAAGESRLASHLHFAMEIDGEAVDPREYLPQR